MEPTSPLARHRATAVAGNAFNDAIVAGFSPREAREVGTKAREDYAASRMPTSPGSPIHESALHAAIEHGDVERVQRLIMTIHQKQGLEALQASMQVTDREGCTALHLAALGNHVGVVQTLVAFRAQARANPNPTPTHPPITVDDAPTPPQLLLPAKLSLASL